MASTSDCQGFDEALQSTPGAHSKWMKDGLLDVHDPLYLWPVIRVVL